MAEIPLLTKMLRPDMTSYDDDKISQQFSSAYKLRNGSLQHPEGTYVEAFIWEIFVLFKFFHNSGAQKCA